MQMNSYAEQLRRFDVCVLSDALDSLQLAGAVAGLSPVWEGATVCGRAVTMKLVAERGARAEYHLGVRALTLAEPGDVIVVEQQLDGDLISAAWGGLLARAAVAARVAGVVIDGNCRDVDEIRQLGLPVMAKGIVPFTARRRYIESTVAEPVSIGAVAVDNGDYVSADGSGLVFIRSADVERVLARAAAIAEREARMVAQIEAGVELAAVLGAGYEEALDGQR